MDDGRDKALHLLFRAITPAHGDPADDLVVHLREMRDAKIDVLTDDEYEAFRDAVIEQITGRVRVPWLWVLILSICSVGGLGLALWGTWTGVYAWVVGCGVAGGLSAYLWWGLEQDYAAKRRLSRAARMAIVDRLLREGLATEREAEQYRAQIKSAFPTEQE